ncbi:MAG: TraM recognition domain-containing protein, partial [Planctomycetaceae bacterium]|nr:TraM recognition domain-containing protein [Planctomycetaceae bacterium]
AVLRRDRRPDRRTLFILDECAQLGTMPLLEQAVTLLRGYGLQVWTFWQDMEQVRANYPFGYKTLINNSAVLQTFGVSNAQMARELSEVVDASPRELLYMDPANSLLTLPGEGSLVCRRPDYLCDPAFEGLWDPNPFFRPSGAEGGMPRAS